MQLGELVQVGVIAPHSESGCPFCRPDEKVSFTNCLKAAHDDDEDPESDNNTDNSSGTLAKNLEKQPQGREVPEIPDGESAPVMTMPMASARQRTWHSELYDAGKAPVLYGAHHLIPGNDSLKSSNIYGNGWLGPVDDGADEQNIGYNINSASNGFWLPGNYAIRPWAEGKPRSPSLEFKKAYAFLAMKDAQRQFHDAHEPFSDYIRGELNDLEKLLKKVKNTGCPSCGAGSKKDSPPYHLNSRLNAISKHITGYLRGQPSAWKAPAFTSSWCGAFKTFVQGEGGWMKASRKLEQLRKRPKI